MSTDALPARRFIIVTDSFSDLPGVGRQVGQAYTSKQTRSGYRTRRTRVSDRCWSKSWTTEDGDLCYSVFTKEEAEHFLPMFSTSGIECQIVELAQ